MSKVIGKNTQIQPKDGKQAKKTEKVEKTTEKTIEKKTQGSVKVTDKTAKKLKENSDEKSKVQKVKKEKGAAPNMKTALIGCALNVNIAKTEMLLFIQKTLGLTFGSIKADCAYVVILESIALYLVGSTGKYNTKNAEKANLYEVTLENLQRVVRESNDFGSELKEVSENYKSGTVNYASSFLGGNKVGSDKILKELLESKAFINTTNVSVNNEALNYVCYMLSHAMGYLTKTSCVLSQFAGLKKVQIKNYRSAVDIHFTGELKQVLFQRIDEVTDKVANSKEEATEATEAVEGEDEGDEGDEGEGEKKKEKKGTKKATKEEPEDEEDEEEEDEEVEEEEEAEAEEEEEEEEEEED